MSREAMKQALEALESDPTSLAWLINKKQAITALRQALVDADDTSQERVDEKAKREQKPVAWTPQVWRQFRPDGTLEFQKIKRTPNGEWEDYTAPQRREWVGLTANEIWECNKAKSGAVEFHICYEHQNLEDFAEAVEAKLKEKNT